MSKSAVVKVAERAVLLFFASLYSVTAGERCHPLSVHFAAVSTPPREFARREQEDKLARDGTGCQLLGLSADDLRSRGAMDFINPPISRR